MADNPIAFFDSGVGGLPYLQRAMETLPAESFVYTADTKHFPYGEKGTSELGRIVIESVGRMIATVAPKAVVIACNTASVVALAELRETFRIPFVGVVPAIKPAASLSRSRSIGVFATSRTVADAYTDQLIVHFASDCKISRVAGTELVRFVEYELLDSNAEERSAAVRPFAGQFREATVDSVVLGCTHFVHLADELAAELGPGISVLDSRDGVTRQIHHVVGELSGSVEASGGDLFGNGRNSEPSRRKPYGDRPGDRRSSARPGRFFVTGSDASGAPASERYRRFAKRYGLEFCGELEVGAPPPGSAAGVRA